MHRCAWYLVILCMLKRFQIFEFISAIMYFAKCNKHKAKPGRAKQELNNKIHIRIGKSCKYNIKSLINWNKIREMTSHQVEASKVTQRLSIKPFLVIYEKAETAACWDVEKTTQLCNEKVETVATTKPKWMAACQSDQNSPQTSVFSFHWNLRLLVFRKSSLAIF